MNGIITETPAGFELDFKYNPHILDRVREIPGRWYKGRNKTWVIPKSSKHELESFAKKYNFQFADRFDANTDPEQYDRVPPLPELTIDIPLRDRSLYTFQKHGVAYGLQKKRSMRGEVMVRIGILKDVSARGKLRDVIEYINDNIDSGNKLGIFANQHSIFDELYKHFPDGLRITGREKIPDREHIKNKWQACGECGVILEDHGSVTHDYVANQHNIIFLGLHAAGVGLTLTAVSTVCFIELPWTGAACDQAEDRFHRIGQCDNVTCIYFIGKDTIDEWVYRIIGTKRDIASEVNGDETVVEEEFVDTIWNLFNQPK